MSLDRLPVDTRRPRACARVSSLAGVVCALLVVVGPFPAAALSSFGLCADGRIQVGFDVSGAGGGTLPAERRGATRWMP